MPAPRILFVKLSSLGDIVHHLPAVTDLARERPGVHVAWIVEEAYVDLVKLHPAVAEAIPLNLRSLRANPLNPSAWGRIARARRSVRARDWDYVIDSQGLIKSAMVARFARAPAFGLDRTSARERLAARFYDVKVNVPWTLHAWTATGSWWARYSATGRKVRRITASSARARRPRGRPRNLTW